jgi:hypothetical protein
MWVKIYYSFGTILFNFFGLARNPRKHKGNAASVACRSEQ